MDNMEQFDAYYRGEMSREEVELFEAELRSNDAFKSQYELFLTSIETINDLAIQNEIATMFRENEASRTGNRSLSLVFKIAASILLVAVIFIAVQQLSNVQKPPYATLFEPYPDVISVRYDQDDLSKALGYYTAKEYTDAITTFDRLPPTDTVNFYKSQCHLALQEYELAIAALVKVSEESVFIEQKNWYLGLSYLLIEDYANARSEFDKVKYGEFQYDKIPLINEP